jgi:hypothetical protein
MAGCEAEQRNCMRAQARGRDARVPCTALQACPPERELACRHIRIHDVKQLRYPRDAFGQRAA